jgi:hypothetical protein
MVVYRGAALCQGCPAVRARRWRCHFVVDYVVASTLASLERNGP